MAGSVTGQSLTHITIRNNHLVQGGTAGGALQNGYGIVLGGVVGNPVFDGTIDDNYVDAYGASNSAGGGNIGAIQLMSTQNTKVTNNYCPTYYQSCIVFYGNNLSSTVTGNASGNLLGAYVAAANATAEIEIASPGSYGVYVDGNVDSPSTTAQAPLALFYNATEAAQVSFGPNNENRGPVFTTVAGTGSGIIVAGTYTSGITAAGAAGTTCNLSAFNSGSSGATATVTLTGTNVIASGTALTITAGGTMASSAPTNAGTVSAGTATSCSAAGGATVATTLGAPTTLVTGNNYPMALSHLPTTGDIYKYGYQSGTVGYDTNYRPAYAFTAPSNTPYAAAGPSFTPAGGGGFYSLDTSSVIAIGSISSGTAPNTMAVTGGISNGVESEWLPVGMNVCVSNAATSTTPLCARILANNGSTVTLDQSAGNTPTGGLLSATIGTGAGSPSGGTSYYCNISGFNSGSGILGIAYFNSAGNLNGQPIIVTNAGSGAIIVPTAASTLTPSQSGVGIICPTSITIASGALGGTNVTWQGGQVSALAPLLTGTTTTQLPPGALSAGSCTSPATVTVNGATVGSPVTANLTSGSPPYGASKCKPS